MAAALHNELSVNTSEVPQDERPFVPLKQECDPRTECWAARKQHVFTGQAGSGSEHCRHENRKFNKHKQGRATCPHLSTAAQSPQGQRAASVPCTARAGSAVLPGAGRYTATGLSANSRQSLTGVGGRGGGAGKVRVQTWEGQLS